jgi:hypothetical protein
VTRRLLERRTATYCRVLSVGLRLTLPRSSSGHDAPVCKSSATLLAEPHIR